mgnify:FL=1|tara:strand:+ start:96 stop:626 length:531 start_codon:yes stop_codon:yes gene_type:complete
MRWLIYILLPLQVYGQEIYTDCGEILPQNYQVEYDINKEYYWEVSDGEIIYENDNIVTIQWPDTAGLYVISVYTTRFGCDGDTSFHEVTVEECAYLQLFIPNTFSPNGDGHNELFFVYGVDSHKVKTFIIYNRWGQKIHEVSGNIPWDGKNSSIGVYTYSVRTHNQHYVGKITLVR